MLRKILVSVFMRLAPKQKSFLPVPGGEIQSDVWLFKSHEWLVTLLDVKLTSLETFFKCKKTLLEIGRLFQIFLAMKSSVGHCASGRSSIRYFFPRKMSHDVIRSRKIETQKPIFQFSLVFPHKDL